MQKIHEIYIKAGRVDTDSIRQIKSYTSRLLTLLKVVKDLGWRGGEIKRWEIAKIIEIDGERLERLLRRLVAIGAIKTRSFENHIGFYEFYELT